MAYPDDLEMPILYKIIQKRYLNDFLDGKLYMNNLKFFVDLEKTLENKE